MELVNNLRNPGSRSEVELHEDREAAADRIEELEEVIEYVLDGWGINGPEYEVDYANDEEYKMMRWMFSKMIGVMQNGSS